MGLVTRQVGPNAKGSKLTAPEMDNNLYYLQSLGVSGVTYSANTLTITNPTGGTKSVTISADTNTFITGTTYNDSTNTIQLTNNNNTSLDVYIDGFSGMTVNGTLSATTISGGTYYGDGSNLSGITISPSYTVYTAYYNVEEDILQVYENTIGSINFSYDSPNNKVIITSSNLFGSVDNGTPEKTVIFLTILNGIQSTINGLEGIVLSSSEIRVSDGSGSSGAMLAYALKFFIEIRVYN